MNLLCNSSYPTIFLQNTSLNSIVGTRIGMERSDLLCVMGLAH